MFILHYHNPIYKGEEGTSSCDSVRTALQGPEARIICVKKAAVRLGRVSGRVCGAPLVFELPCLALVIAAPALNGLLKEY